MELHYLYARYIYIYLFIYINDSLPCTSIRGFLVGIGSDAISILPLFFLHLFLVFTHTFRFTVSHCLLAPSVIGLCQGYVQRLPKKKEDHHVAWCGAYSPKSLPARIEFEDPGRKARKFKHHNRNPGQHTASVPRRIPQVVWVWSGWTHKKIEAFRLEILGFSVRELHTWSSPTLPRITCTRTG